MPKTLTEAEIRDELFSDHREIHRRFLEEFPREIEQLVSWTHRAHVRIAELGTSLKRDLRAAWTEAFLLSALDSLVVSAKLLLAGLLPPAGNQMRAYCESCAMALLVSHHETGILERVQREDNFPVQKAVETVEKKENRRRLEVDSKDWSEFKRIRSWYDKYSHASLFALASQIRFDQPGKRFLGSGFDEAKVDAYRKELNSLVRGGGASRHDHRSLGGALSSLPGCRARFRPRSAPGP